MRIVPSLFVSGLLLSLLFAACDANRVYEEGHSLNQAQLHKDSILVFTPSVSDTITAHTIFLSLLHDGDFAFQNVIFFVEVISPLGISIKDTINYDLADDRGKWYVKKTAGLYNHYIPYRRFVRFPVSGDYEIRIQQGMRVDQLKHIHHLGVRIESHR